MKYAEKTASRLMVGETFVDRFGFHGAEGSFRTDLQQWATGEPNTFPAFQDSHPLFDIAHVGQTDEGQVVLVNPNGQYLYLPADTTVTVCESPWRRAYIGSVRGWGKIRHRLG